MKPRIASVERKTKETEISMTINLDGTENIRLQQGFHFLTIC